MLATGTPDFLKLFLCRLCVCVCACVRACVCVPTPRLLLTSGMIWTPYEWLNKFYSCCMVIVIGIINGHGFGISMYHGYYPYKSKLALYKVVYPSAWADQRRGYVIVTYNTFMRFVSDW